MDSFLDRYYNELDDNLNDPNLSIRTTKTKKLQLLNTIEKQIWERLLTATGQESMLGYTETSITLQNNVEYYTLPGNFRQFLRLERWLEGDRTKIMSKLDSVPHYDPGPGIEILDSKRGFIIHPTPQLSESQTDWVLIYQKGPVVLCNFQAKEVGDNNVVGTTPPADGGTMVLIDDYYTGSLLRIYDAATGSPQTGEIIKFKAESKTFVMRHDWVPRPTGVARAEIQPALPEDYDSIYALDAALRILGRRGKGGHRRELISERNELWNACKNYFSSNVADRGPGRSLPVSWDEPDTGYDPSWL